MSPMAIQNDLQLLVLKYLNLFSMCHRTVKPSFDAVAKNWPDAQFIEFYLFIRMIWLQQTLEN
jgi:hypothetical protein